ncbi:DUF1076 domain-containing protein [Salmonella enterica subsp. salamae]|nr:DUF1076 domain-containing protein [Salmonella enterica subsp. salamae]
MPNIILTLPVDTSGFLQTPLSQDILGRMQGATQSSSNGVTVQLGNNLHQVRYLPGLTLGSGSFSINTDSLSLLRGYERALAEENVNYLCSELSNYRGPIDVETTIDSCSFSVAQENLSLSAEHLTCPLTLDVPEQGVFALTSLQSDICCLYDTATLKELVSRNLPHPVSREVITSRHIVPKEQCYFDSGRGAFIRSAPE